MSANVKKLSELAKTFRSKNAGTDKITFDVIFREKDVYEMVKRSKVLSRETVCTILGIAPERITDFVEYDPAYAEDQMHGIIYLVGLVVVILAILSFFGLR